KSAFLYGTIEEEVYVYQPPGFVDPAQTNKVYKVVKALYGLHQALRACYETLSSFLLEDGFRRGTIDKTLFIKKNKSNIMLVQVYVDDIIFGSTKKSICAEFEEVMHKRFQMSSMGELTFFLGLQVKKQPDGIFISQDKYIADILKKFDFCSIKTATTPIESNKPLVKDEDGVEVDVHEYRSMIGSLMYLTVSRPDIMFVVCACARFQVTPKASHLHAIKRIFRYLKYQPKLGLWYPRDSPFELEAFSNSDYAGASLNMKSTTGGCQFLSRRLLSWQCKKQTIVANSTTKAEYVAAAHCCGQVVKALYGLHQAPRAWYETLSSFLLENGFRRGTIDKTLFIKKNKSDIMLVQVYVDDIIFGSTKKSMCTEFEEVKQQPDGIFISQDKYVADILKKFDFCSIKTATTPIESNKPLVKDEDGVEVDVHEYRSMIGSLMYLTASRPDIMFAVCACARFQVTPKASHLHVVKRIFRYLKHQPKLGLWYPRDSPFELEAFSDSDYAGASLDRKSTTGGCQFLGRRLISWQCKKQTIVANSTTEAEYVAAAHCCGQNPVYHSRTKHIEIRHHFIRDCYEKRLIDVLKIHTDSNVADLLTKGFDVTRISMDLRMDRCSAGNSTSYWYALTHNPTIYDSLVKQFWQTATVRTLANRTQQLVASINSTEYIITGASVRSKL
ncbi:uncharacterized mitochondrial protein-like protein, partial [Tanacetum coccineum]